MSAKDPIAMPVSAPLNPGTASGDSVASANGDVFVLPASFGQERFWALDRQRPGNPTWMVPVRFRLQGALNPEFVLRAFNEIVRRHETLRTTFVLVDGQLSQTIKPDLKIKVPVIDLRHLPKTERDTEADRVSLEEARRGFDLGVGPLFRVTLLRVEDLEHFLLVTPHHAVADYWSVGLIANELGALYQAYSSGSEPLLPKLQVQYGDFAVWQQEQSTSAAMQGKLAYWKEQLRDLPLLDFPTDRPRASSPTFQATITSILLPVKLTDAAKTIANREGATFFNTMLAVLALLMHQYTGQSDFGIATQVAGRTTVELEPLIGMFVNNVVLRMDVSGNPGFPELLKRVQEVGLQSLANQDLRFEQLLKELRPNDYPSHHTLFRVNFICQRDPVKPLEFSGIKLTVIPSKSQGALYDLNVFLVLRNEGWRLACEYNTDLYEGSTISRLLADYQKLLEAIVDDPCRPLSGFPTAEGARFGKQTRTDPLPLASAASLSAVTVTDAQSTVAPAASPKPVSVPVVAALPQDADCFVMPASVSQRRFWVLEELMPGNPALHMRACVRLRGSLSLSALKKSFQVVVDRHEILRTTFKNVNGEVVQIIASSREVSFPITSIEDVSEPERERYLEELIRIEVSAAFELARGPLIRARLFCLGPEEHVLVITTHHILCDGWSQGVIQRDLWAVYEDLTAAREPSLEPLAIQYGDFAYWQHEWLNSEGARGEIEYWKKQLAAPLPVLNFPTDRSPRNRPATKGAMETLLFSEDLVRSLKKLSQSFDVTMFTVMLAAYGALLCRYSGQEELLVGSPVANRSLEAEPLIGPFAGLVELRLNLPAQLTLREALTRVRDVTLDALSHADLPFEALLEHLEVRSQQGRNPLSQFYFFYQAAFLQPRQLNGLNVVPMRDIPLGTFFELQMGVLERSEGVRAQLEYNPDLFDAGTVQNILKDYAAVLDAFVSNLDERIEELSVTPPKLRAVSPVELKTEVKLPQDQTERQLARIWEELLGLRSVGFRQNYFDLGGNSLLAVRLFAQIENVFHVKLPLTTLFEAQTIEEFARILRDRGAMPGWSPLVEIQKHGSRPAFFCVHAAGGNVLTYRALSHYLGTDQPFYGLQAQGLDGERPLLARIEDMAALYVSEIRKFRPRGPYLLGGYCMGGNVALEMAQQLKAQGEEVGLLALFDTLNWSELPPSTVFDRPYYQIQRIIFHVQNFSLLNFRDKVQFFRKKLAVLRSRLTIWRGMVFGRLGHGSHVASTESLLLSRMWDANDRASLEYVARPYPGVITDFRPVKQYSRYKNARLYWDAVALEGVKVVTLPVYPAGMLLEPFVKDLATALRSAIDQALSPNQFFCAHSQNPTGEPDRCADRRTQPATLRALPIGPHHDM